MSLEHLSRPAWEALLRPTDLAEGFDPLPVYAEAHRVRLDVGTGVCVSAREVGGPAHGSGQNLEILHATP